MGDVGIHSAVVGVLLSAALGLKLADLIPFMAPTGWMALALALSIASFFLRNQLFTVFCFSACTAWFTAFSAHVPDRETSGLRPNDEMAIYVAEVVSVPKSGFGRWRMEGQLYAVMEGADTVFTRTKCLIVLQQLDDLPRPKPGQILAINGNHSPVEHTGNPGTFDYGAYLNSRGIDWVVQASDARWLVLTQRISMVSISHFLQQSVVDRIAGFDLSDRARALVEALAIGYKHELSHEMRDAFAKAGAMHVLAVSGLHVGIVFMILQAMAKVLPARVRRHHLTQVMQLLSLWTFAVATGMSASVMRACTMCSLLALSKMTHRKTSGLQIVAFSALVQVFFAPTVLFEVGFQLSYLAVAGIIYMQPLLHQLLRPRSKPARWCWSAITVSLAAQVVTTPVSLYYFHQFPNYFLLTNIWIIPLATLLLVLTLGLLVLSIQPWCSLGFLERGVSLLADMLISGCERTAQLPLATSSGWYPTVLTVVLAYLVGALCLQWLRRPRMIVFSWLVVLVGVCLWSSISLIWHERRRIDFAVCRFTRDEVAAIHVTSSVYWIVPDSSTNGGLKQWQRERTDMASYWQVHREEQLPLENVLFSISDFRLSWLALPPTLPLQVAAVDAICVGRSVPPSGDLLDQLQPKLLILQASIYPRRVAEWREAAQRRNIPCYNVRTEGAWLKRIRQHPPPN